MGADDLRAVLAALKAHEEAAPFLTPVLWKEWNLLDYPEIVKNPMDLSTVESKIESYQSLAEFEADLNLIWSNCRLYNPPESEYAKMADRMERLTFDAIARLQGKQPDRPATEAQKSNFVRGARALSERDLGVVIETVSRLCPEALLKISDEKMSVDVDKLDAPLLDYLAKQMPSAA